MTVNIFRLARILGGRKQKEVALEAQIPLSSLSQIENGWLVPKPHQLRKLERTLPKLKIAKTLIE